MTCAVISICGFIIRGTLKLQGSAYLSHRWIKTLPHINDTILLGCAVYLTVRIQQFPFGSGWLTAKLLALFFYIAMGMVVMRFAKTQQQRLLAFALALVSFAYIVLVALYKTPLPVIH